MENNNKVRIDDYCLYRGIEFSFIHALHEFGLIEIFVSGDQQYLSHDQLTDVEKMIRFHYELDINLEGIDVISNLLNQIHDLQESLKSANNRLTMFDMAQ